MKSKKSGEESKASDSAGAHLGDDGALTFQAGSGSDVGPTTDKADPSHELVDTEPYVENALEHPVDEAVGIEVEDSKASNDPDTDLADDGATKVPDGGESDAGPTTKKADPGHEHLDTEPRVENTL